MVTYYDDRHVQLETWEAQPLCEYGNCIEEIAHLGMSIGKSANCELTWTTGSDHAIDRTPILSRRMKIS